MACPGRQDGGHALPSEPQQACVPASSPRRGTPPTSTPAAGSEQLQPLQVIGGELDPTEIVGDGLRAAYVSCHALGGAHGRVPLVATLSRRGDDPMPTTGRTSRWGGTGSCLSRHGNEPGRPRRLGFHGTLSARSYFASGDGSSPKGDDFAPTASGRISPPKAVVSLTQATDGSLRLASMVRAASKARTRWPLTCGFRCPAEDPGHEGVPEVDDPEVRVRVVGQRGGEPEAGKRRDDHLERLGRVAAVGGRVGQRVDHLGPVPERLGPAVGADQWDRVRPTPGRRMKCTGTPSTWTR
jgi:hypothetical protein